jgi:hypothetical protein
MRFARPGGRLPHDSLGLIGSNRSMQLEVSGKYPSGGARRLVLADPHEATAGDGRGGFRTCDLSRVKRDHALPEQPPHQGRLF